MLQLAALVNKPSLTIRVDIDQDHRIGHGKIELLEAINSCGSIAKAGRHLKMCYSRASDLVAEINETFGREVVKGRAGGRKGGGAQLTPFGLKLVHRYRNIERRVEDAVQGELDGLRAELGSSAPERLGVGLFHSVF